MIVMKMPETPSLAVVHVNGKAVGKIAKVTAEAAYTGFDGQTHVGERWLPEGLPTTLVGPTTMNEATLLLLAENGYDPQASMVALGFFNPSGKDTP